MLSKLQELLQDMLLMKWLGAKVCKDGATIAVLYLVIMIGHEVVRLPVAHCELNPIEMAWSQVKGHVKRNNKRYGTESIIPVYNIDFKIYADRS